MKKQTVTSEEKGKDYKIIVRSDIVGEIAKELEQIKKWLGTTYMTEALKFCIHQTYLGLKEGKVRVDENIKENS